MTIKEKLSALRAIMERESLDAYIISGTDPHNSEYLPAAWKQRQWISGFTGSFGTVVVLKNEAVAAVLSPAAKKCGFKDKGYICYEEDAQESVVLRELLDKKLWNIPDRIKDKGQFEEKLNQSIRQYNPEYWRARQSGREAVEAARSTAPAKEAAR